MSPYQGLKMPPPRQAPCYGALKPKPKPKMRQTKEEWQNACALRYEAMTAGLQQFQAEGKERSRIRKEAEVFKAETRKNQMKRPKADSKQDLNPPTKRAYGDDGDGGPRKKTKTNKVSQRPKPKGNQRHGAKESRGAKQNPKPSSKTRIERLYTSVDGSVPLDDSIQLRLVKTFAPPKGNVKAGVKATGNGALHSAGNIKPDTVAAKQGKGKRMRMEADGLADEVEYGKKKKSKTDKLARSQAAANAQSECRPPKSTTTPTKSSQPGGGAKSNAERPEKSAPRIVGIERNDKSCYMNGPLQFLHKTMAVEKLKQQYKKRQGSQLKTDKDCLIEDIIKVLKNMDNCEPKKAIAIDEFKKRFGSLHNSLETGKPLDGGDFEDCTEFLELLLEDIRQSCQIDENGQSFVDDLYKAQIGSSWKCSGCGLVSEMSDIPSYITTLALEGSAAGDLFEDLLFKVTNGKLVEEVPRHCEQCHPCRAKVSKECTCQDGNCTACGELTPHLRTQFLIKSPQHLIMKINRVGVKKTGKNPYYKIRQPVQLPMDESSVPQKLQLGKDTSSQEYEMSGFVKHDGTNWSCGHYISWWREKDARDQKMKWTKCNDEIVSAPIEKLTQFPAPGQPKGDRGAYLIFLEKQRLKGTDTDRTSPNLQ